jgi:cob(I)alamin adenosyltransferase
MKVTRVVINDGQVQAGVVFDTGPGTVGRAIVDLPEEACAAILAAAQVELDKGTAEISQEVQSTALTTELHRLRNAKQEYAALLVDQAKAIDEHAARVAVASTPVEEPPP